MITKNIDINLENEAGARPVAMLVQVASRYKSRINIQQDNRTVNAKSIMGMMTLGLIPGQQVEVLVDGEDEAQAMENIEEFLSGKK
ncbi:MAG: HPr family phosphocarrier protein [Lachnospiraceae bacterium]|nr:HPr family phosphocarrier protein [Lachnospiraceae bacterium]